MKNVKMMILALSSIALLGSCTASSGSQSLTSAAGSSAQSSSSSQQVTDPYATPADYVAFTGTEADMPATEIQWWDTFGASGTTATTMKQLITAFQAVYPNITVTRTSKDSYPNIYSAISQAIPGGTAPTMAIAYPDHVASYLYSGAVENLAGYIADPVIGLGVNDKTNAGALSDYVQSYMGENTNYASNGVYSMPFTKSTEVMFYNKTQFDANNWSVPETWTEMWNTCKSIKESGATGVTPLGYDSDDNLFITKCEQEKIDYTSASTPHYLFNNAKAKSMVTDLKTNYDKGYFLTKGTSANSTYTSTQFTNQTLYMTVGSTGGTTYNYTEDFDIGVAGIPQADTNSPKVISQGPSICMFKSATQNQRYAAWLFYKFVTNASNTALWSTVTGYNPVRTSAYTTDVWTEWESEAESSGGKQGLIKAVADFVKTNYASAYFSSPAFRGSSTARTEVGGIVSSVLLGNKTVDTAFSDAMAQCAQIKD
jgi:multiple sugar transport system substrate-binding protein